MMMMMMIMMMINNQSIFMVVNMIMIMINIYDEESHVLTAASKFLWTYNVKSYSTKFSDNF